MVLTRRGGTSFLRTCISCIQSNPQTVPAFNRTCRQYLRHLPSVPASPANATGESTNAVYRVVSDVDSRVHASNAYLRTNLRRNHHNTRFLQIHEVVIHTHRTCTVYRYFGQFRVGMTTRGSVASNVKLHGSMNAMKSDQPYPIRACPALLVLHLCTIWQLLDCRGPS